MLMRASSLVPLLLSIFAACSDGADPEATGSGDPCTMPVLTDAPAPASALTTFSYDRAAAYDPALSPITTGQGVDVHALSFQSPRGPGRASGFLFVPEGAGPFEQDGHVGELVLRRLEGADRHAELLPGLGVLE